MLIKLHSPDDVGNGFKKQFYDGHHCEYLMDMKIASGTKISMITLWIVKFNKIVYFVLLTLMGVDH